MYEKLKDKIQRMMPLLNEKQLRRYLGSEAEALGHGGIEVVSLNQSGVEVHVSHFPPGTSKWNKIEHRMFCYISSHWRGQPLISIETIITLIGSTTTTKGLKIKCVKDDSVYNIGKKVSDEDLAAINMKYEKTCPDWNYII